MDSGRSARIRNYGSAIRSFLVTANERDRLEALIRRMDAILTQLPRERGVPATRRPHPQFPVVKIGYEERGNLACCVCLDDFQVFFQAKELPCTVSIYRMAEKNVKVSHKTNDFFYLFSAA